MAQPCNVRRGDIGEQAVITEPEVIFGDIGEQSAKTDPKTLVQQPIKMEQQNPNNTPDGSGDVPLKRKRGRPRKYPKPDAEESSYITHSQNKKLNPVRTEHAPVPPGFNAVNGNQQLQRAQENVSNNASVGQRVSGIIEAVFEAGYLLSVTVGDSDTRLRGLVFKPERYVPVSPENDVAPGVPMIHRNEVPFPPRTTEFQTPPPKANNGQPGSGCKVETLAMNGLPAVPQVPGRTVNLVASSGNNFPSVAGQTTHQLATGNTFPSVAGQTTHQLATGNNFPSVAGQTTHQLARGTVAPVVLQPSNFSNGMPVSNQPSQVTPVSIGSGVIAGKEIPVYGNQEPASNAQTSQNMLPSGLQTERVPHYQSSDTLNGNDAKSPTAKSLTAPNVHFEQLVTEVVRRIETPSDAMDTETGNSKPGENILVKDPSPVQEDKVNDMDQSVLIKPLQAVQSPLDAMDTETGNSKPDNIIPVKDPSTGQEEKVNNVDQSVLIKPLQAVQSHLQEDSTSAPKASDNTETGKTVELFQNDKSENQATKPAELESGNKMDDISNTGTGL